MHLGAAYLIKNEIDIIESNIRFHASVGVDSFTIIENGSTDGTREKLQELKNEFLIHIIDRPEHTYQFHKWRKEVVDIAGKVFNPDLVICCDADEFWLPIKTGESLKDHLHKDDCIVSVERFNMLPSRAVRLNGEFYDTNLKVKSSINYSKDIQINRPDIGMLLCKISPKVAVSPKGLLSLNGGNHRAKHLQFWKSRDCSNISVYHFPIRTYEHFMNNVSNRSEVIKKKDLKIRIGDHYRRWAKILEDGNLKEEYNKFFYDDAELELLKKIGIIELDDDIKNRISQALKSKTS